MPERVEKSRRQRKVAHHPKMGQDLFKYLPSEIIFNILSRLPAKTTMSCKCVCKPWLDLLRTPEFVKSHLSKSVPGLAVFEWKTRSKPYKIIEFVDEDDLNYRWNIVFNLRLPFHEALYSSVDGLLFLQNHFLCNPITRDYLKIPSPPEPSSRMEIYGFGVSRMTGQYKVVRVFIESGAPPEFVECQVYTVGTRLWRGIASDGTLRYEENRVGAFLNGNLHWLARKGSSTLISCLDLESELFKTFSAPPLQDIDKCMSLSVLGDCLCLCVCDNSEDSETFPYKNDIWLMKEYEDEKSWTKEFVIRKDVMDDNVGYLCPIKVFKDGDILMKFGNRKLLYYSSKTKTIQEVDGVFGLESEYMRSMTIFTPSFFSLKTFAMENVTSFWNCGYFD